MKTKAMSREVSSLRITPVRRGHRRVCLAIGEQTNRYLAVQSAFLGLEEIRKVGRILGCEIELDRGILILADANRQHVEVWSEVTPAAAAEFGWPADAIGESVGSLAMGSEGSDRQCRLRRYAVLVFCEQQDMRIDGR